MGKIILNDIEYGIGISNGVNVDTTNLVEKDNIVTTLDDTVTDEQIPSAKAVHTAIQNVSTGVPADVYSKTEVDNLLADKADSTDIIDSYSKTEVDNLLNDKADSSSIVDAYSKTEVDNLLDSKVDSSSIVDAYSKDETNDLLDAKVNVDDLVDAYSKTEMDTLLDDKANVDDIVDAYTKEEVDNLLDAKADSTDIIDAYSKTEVDDLLTGKADTTALEQLEGALTGYSTLEYLEEVKTDLENEIANINIPTTLPASDVYAWAKASTKPTYTASEVGALASDGTAVNASKVNNALTLQIAGTTKNTFNGSSAQTFNIPNASTSTAGVMTTAQVTKLNGIDTGATKNTIDTAMSSTSTNAVQNKVIYAYIQEQIKNAVKGAGDYMGKTMVNVSVDLDKYSSGYTYTNSKGGFADLMLYSKYASYANEFSLIVDGTTIVTNGAVGDILKQIGNSDNNFELKIPFTSTFTVKQYVSGDTLQGFIYVNK